MKINTKDVLSGAILILLAVVAAYLNTEHALGTARRMGPGYMPLMTFILLGFLGITVLAIGLFNGPDPLEKWTSLEVAAVPLAIVAFFVTYFIVDSLNIFTGNYYVTGFGALVGCLVLAIAPGWRPLGLVHAGMAVFALMLDQLGLMLAVAGCIIVACLADRKHRPLGVLATVVFLCIVCWLVFIVELDIRVYVWPQFLSQ